MIRVRLEEFEPGRWRVKKRRDATQRAENMPLPFVISDEMPAAEHVDGNFYTSKARFRATTRAHGLTEVGNEKQKPKWRSTDLKTTKEERKNDIQKAVARYKRGERLHES